MACAPDGAADTPRRTGEAENIKREAAMKLTEKKDQQILLGAKYLSIFCEIILGTKF